MITERTEIDFSLVRGEPRRVDFAGRNGTFYPADGIIKWDYLNTVGDQPEMVQASGSLVSLEPIKPQLDLPPQQDGK